MYDILVNPVTISVIVMCLLCLFKLNVVLSLIIAAVVAGLTSGAMGMSDIFGFIISGLSRNGENALAYLLLGTFAAALADTGLATVLSKQVTKVVGDRKWVMLAALAIIGCISGTLVPVHIAYIPILFPALLKTMNKMKMDRRQAACATEFGLVAMYPSIPIGYGLIFMGIIADSMTQNGTAITIPEIWPNCIILLGGMLVGLFASCWYFRKPRDYKDIDVAGADLAEMEDVKMGKDQWVAIIAIAAVLFGQLYYGSMPLGALFGLVVMVIGGAVKLNKTDSTLAEGIRIMGMISFVMLVAGGYANVVNNTGAVQKLIDASMTIIGGTKFGFVFVLLILGLLITMGIGTSFGTIPVIALLYVPMCARMGLSAGACACLIACAATLGDAGSPASDSTLGPTAGLNADGQHDHIWDTCVPTFLFFNIPLFIAGLIGGMIL